MAHSIQPFLRTIDRVGTFVLAIQGASIAAVHGLDMFGVLVVSLVSAMGGGIIRDLLIGAHPPEALRGEGLILIALSGGLVTFFAYRFVHELPELALLCIDAAGLSLLAVNGTEKTLEFGLNRVVAVMMGGISGVGGGTVRDMLLAKVPDVLRVDFVASSALIGSAVLVLARYCGLKAERAALLGGVTCGALRLLSGLQHWHLPTLGGLG